MRSQVSGPVAIAVVVAVLVAAIVIGWTMMNRELKPVNPPKPGSGPGSPTKALVD